MQGCGALFVIKIRGYEREKSMKQRSDYIGILDGIRAYSILIVAGFHLWQQSWLQNLFPSNLLQFMGRAEFQLKLGTAHGLHVCRRDAADFGILPLFALCAANDRPLAPEPDNLRTFFKSVQRAFCHRIICACFSTSFSGCGLRITRMSSNTCRIFLRI